MMSQARRHSVGDHPPEDTFTIAPALSGFTGRVAFSPSTVRITESESGGEALPIHMMNTGYPRAAPKPVPVPQLGGLDIYIAGPMTGIPHFNFPAFDAAEKVLKSHGHRVFNPAQKDRERHGYDISVDNPAGDPALAVRDHGFSLRDALRDDTHYLCTTATAIAMLPGWEWSKGARMEHDLAIALGLQILYLGGFYV